jgi:hypothetical protein
MVSLSSSGSFKKTEQFLKAMTKLPSTISSVMHQCGKEGVEALKNETPRDSGRVASSWDYEVFIKDGRYSLTWTNNDIEEGFPVAIMLQYGYATGTGGYVQGVDYINPTLRPIFDRIRDKVWKAVTSA